ncbi:MAG: Maf family protein [Catonella sp.]|uniref:Maf family protein n=1 Tax=Catonella sp. TaxID=2382125 RepID=UPI003FA0A968
MTKYILASASPRRVEILGKLGFEFNVEPSEAEEKLKKDFNKLSPKEKVEELSFIKAADVAESLILTKKTEEGDAYIVIGADTVVAVDNQILEKPKDREDARIMIETLQGRSHDVYTGVTLIYIPESVFGGSGIKVEDKYLELFKILENQMSQEKDEEFTEFGSLIKELLNENRIIVRTFSEKTEVSVYPMNEAEVEGYISTLEPYDKAGGYAIQGRFSVYIEKINGDYSNVVGLPAGRLYREIKEVYKCTKNLLKTI